MKKHSLLKLSVILIVVFCLSAFAFAETKYVNSLPGKQKGELLYGQWNACNFGKSKLEDSKKKNPDGTKKIKTLMVRGVGEVPVITYMAKIAAPLDFLVIQEVSTSDSGAQAVAKLADELNRTGAKWDYYISDKTTGDGTERFAILWKTSVVSFFAKPKSGLVQGLAEKMDREPLHAQFKVSGKDLHIYSYHLVPTPKNPESEAATIGANKAQFQIGATIMSGDFNLGHKVLDKYFEGMLGLTHNTEGKTSLKSKGTISDHMAEEYDNIYSGPGIQVTDSGIFDFVTNVGDLKEARKLSDHAIVYIKFRMK